MTAFLIPPKRGRVGELTLDQVRQMRSDGQATRQISLYAGVSVNRICDVLRALGLAYSRGGARPNSGPKPRAHQTPGERW